MIAIITITTATTTISIIKGSLQPLLVSGNEFVLEPVRFCTSKKTFYSFLHMKNILNTCNYEMNFLLLLLKA